MKFSSYQHIQKSKITSLQFSWCAAKSSLNFNCKSDISAYSFSYSETLGAPNFYWTNLPTKINKQNRKIQFFSQLNDPIWKKKRITWTYSRAEEGLSFCSYNATRTGSNNNNNKMKHKLKFSWNKNKNKKRKRKKRRWKRGMETFGESIKNATRI